MKAIENTHRLLVAAYAKGFTLSGSNITDWTMELSRQTSKGRLVLFLHNQTLADGRLSYHAQLDWKSDDEACTDFSMIPFDVNEDNKELTSCEQFEAVIANTLKFHGDQLIED